MKVFYDNSIFDLQKFGGISKYHVQLIKYLHLEGRDEILLGVSNTDNFELLNLEFLKLKKITKGNLSRKLINYYKGNLPYFFAKDNNWKLTKQIREKGDYDIFHPTYYEKEAFKYSGKLVVTIHDMIFELYPEYYKGNKIIDIRRDLCSKADLIIAVSENTKKDIIKFYGVDDSKIQVIYHGLPEYLDTNQKSKCNTPYILYVGGRDKYKNFTNFVHAVCPLLNQYDISVICSGKKFTAAEKDLINSYDATSRFFQYFMSEEELAVAFKNCLMFIYPSTYEGFGLPLLDAMLYKAPILTSNISSMPEVAGQAALYFDPLSVSSISTAIEELISSKSKRDLLVENGASRLKHFSTWKETTFQTRNSYESIL